MSRSRRKNPCAGITTARSDKPFKVQEHRAERRAVGVTLRTTLDQDAPALQHVYGDPWRAPKDGKQWWDDCDAKFLRK